VTHEDCNEYGDITVTIAQDEIDRENVQFRSAVRDAVDQLSGLKQRGREGSHEI
jgi:hypothetical protein